MPSRVITTKKHGYKIVIDETDWPLVSQWRVTVNRKKAGHGLYAVAFRRVRPGKQERVALHRLIMGIHAGPPDVQVDHINHNTLDNRRENLRLCTAGQNTQNRRGTSKLGFKGVQVAGSVSVSKSAH